MRTMYESILLGAAVFTAILAVYVYIMPRVGRRLRDERGKG